MKKRKTTEEFIEEARKIHGDKYDYSKVEYINCDTKVCIICPIHGEFWQMPVNHLSGQGCIKCGFKIRAEKKTSSVEEFIKRAKEIHGNYYDYSKVEYINNSTKVCIICPVHGEFWQTPSKHLSGQNCPFCNSSKGELKIQEYLNKRNIKYIHDQPCLDFLGKMRPDFYLPDHTI